MTPLRPEDVPATLIDLAWEARLEAPAGAEITRMLMAVIPEIQRRERERITAAIEAELAADGDGSSWDGGMSNAARIARGEPAP